MRSSGIPDGGDFAAELLLRDGRAWTNVDGSWRSLPLPADAGAGGGISAAAFQQLARHVQDVRVAEHQIVDGKPVTTIAGEIDTEGMLETVTKLGSVAGGVEGFSLDFAKLGIELGDIEAVLTIDDRTHLLDAAIVSFTMSAEGRELEFELRYRLTSANEPVELPTP
jgi:hypothetical protein